MGMVRGEMYLHKKSEFGDGDIPDVVAEAVCGFWMDG